MFLDSDAFDAQWYLDSYPDVQLSGLSAAEHFWRIGRRIGRQGSERDSSATADAEAANGPLHPVSYPDAQPWVHLAASERHAIASTGLFDEDWYRLTYGSRIRNFSDLLADYLSNFDADPDRDPGPLFSTSGYLETHKDVAGMHPLIHFATHGIQEGRAAFCAKKANLFLDATDRLSVSSIGELIKPDREVIVLHWEDGNFFFSEIAEYTTDFLRQQGIDARCQQDASAAELADATVVVVAPHEFCVYGPGREWSQKQIQQTIFLNTEQWHTSWFTLAYKFLIQSRKVLDINPSSAAGLKSLGVDAAFIPLLPLQGGCFDRADQPLSDRLVTHKAVKTLTHPAAFNERPYDVLFVGVLNKRRARALAGLAPTLQEYDCFLHCPEFNGPVRSSDPDMINNSDLVQLARNSKILLNIHQGDSEYFEWHRLFLSGMMEGCVVVTEKSISTGIVRPGEHYLEAKIHELPELISRLLSTPEGRKTMERIHENCAALRDVVDAGERFFQ